MEYSRDNSWNSSWNSSWNKNINSEYKPWKTKKVNYNKYSAGILPYSYDSTGNCFLLLGKDYSGDWSDFGGRSEYIDKNNDFFTASREFYEETLGCVNSIQETIDKIQNGNPIKIISKTLNGSPYYMYFMYIDYCNYLEIFNKTSNFIKYINQGNTNTGNINQGNTKFKNNINSHKLIEKVSIRWVSIDTIISCIECNGTDIEPPIRLRSVFFKSILLSKNELLFISKN
jgi:hypothetical protein